MSTATARLKSPHCGAFRSQRCKDCLSVSGCVLRAPSCALAAPLRSANSDLAPGRSKASFVKPAGFYHCHRQSPIAWLNSTFPQHNNTTPQQVPHARARAGRHSDCRTLPQTQPISTLLCNIIHQPLTHRLSDLHFTMGYEDSVYLAKLAEQAERYEGKCISILRPRAPLTRAKRWSRT